MKFAFLLLFYSCLLQSANAQFPVSVYPPYDGYDLGMVYSGDSLAFRIWSPTASAAELLFYTTATEYKPATTIQLDKSVRGTWYTKLPVTYKGMCYVFRVLIGGKWSNEVVDPYAKAVGVNGRRAMVVDPAETDPVGWKEDKSPRFSENSLPNDAVLYELHIRDASIAANSGIINKGKFKGLAEEGTALNGATTGLAHLKELGVTHIHLLPFFDYNSIDESKPGEIQYNWGYDPLNYNVPEGSYSTNATDGITRIKELKEMIAAFHRNGLRVVMDVVYNHTALTTTSNFNQLVPNYYYRHKADGSFSDATACGNETASEMPMMRKFMIESLLYWVKEYHVDGFRFDLMGVHDIETMNMISSALHAAKPDIVLYGEGWTAGDSPLPDSMRATKANASKLKGIAVFSDDIRDGIKGSVFNIKDRGFVSGKKGMEASIKFGVVAACDHPQIDYSAVNYSKKPYAAFPDNVVTYCECHDNHTLWDKLALSFPKASVPNRTKMHQLALTIVLTSQGVPFLHAGTEMLRSKKGVENSYKSGDSINAIDWQSKIEHKDLVDYTAKLIHMRRLHPCFRMTNTRQMAEYIRFEENVPSGVVAYTINGAAIGDQWKKVWIGFNGTGKTKSLKLPVGNWKNAVDNATDALKDHVRIPKYGAVILYQGDQ